MTETETRSLLEQVRNEILEQITPNEVIDFVAHGGGHGDVVVAASERTGDPFTFFVVRVIPATLEVAP